MAIGTTKRGIGPCYSSKMARTGVRVSDLLNWEGFERKVRGKDLLMETFEGCICGTRQGGHLEAFETNVPVELER